MNHRERARPWPVALVLIVLLALTARLVHAQATVRPLPSLRASAAAVRVDDVPYVEFGRDLVATANELSSSVARLAPAILSNGSVAVSDDASILLFASTGQFIRRLGRRGGGPGEFGGRGLDGLCAVRGDTIVAWSGTDRRVTAFLPDGTVAGTWPYPEALSPATTSCDREGTVVFRSVRIANPGTDHPTATGHVGHFSGRGRLQPIGSLPVVASLGGVREAFVRLYPARELLTARASDFGFTILARAGGASREFRSRDTALAYTAEDHAAFRRNTIPAGLSGAQREMMEASLRKQPRPATWPAIAGLLVDEATGDIWLRLYTRDRLAQEWVIVSPATRRVRRVNLPSESEANRWRLLAIRGNILTVEWRDADDLPHVGTFQVISNTSR